ncbi:bola-like protein [Dentipellis sp. KUC8613]|nr:bola-like protein [Dentipellis sp. KUC8613]
MPVTPRELEEAIRAGIVVHHLEIIDESSGCGDKYSVLIVSEAFQGKNTLARHRFVNELLKREIADMHAFTQKTLTPEQWEAQKARG